MVSTITSNFYGYDMILNCKVCKPPPNDLAHNMKFQINMKFIYKKRKKSMFAYDMSCADNVALFSKKH